MLPPFPPISSLRHREIPFAFRISGVRWWMAYAGAAWTDSFMRKALTRSQMAHTKIKN